MTHRIFRDHWSPYQKIGTIVQFLFVLGLLSFNLYVGSAALVIALAHFAYSYNESKKKTRDFEKYAEAVTREMEELSQNFLQYNSQPVCMIDQNNTILWYNERFSDLYDDVEMMSTSLAELSGLHFDDLAYKDPKSPPILFSRNDKIFRVMNSQLKSDGTGSLLLCLFDVTGFEKLKILYSEEKPCYAYLNVDNFDELIDSSPDERKSILASEIETVIRQWTNRLSGTMLRYKSGKYFVVFEQKNVEKLEAGKFAILDEMRSVETDADFPASLSIGIGIGGKTLNEMESFGLAALDLALGRGGDQAVVKRRSRVEYYGGKLQTVEKRNKGKSRIMAHALRQMIDQSEKVLIMGHKNPDMDSLGASLGVARIVKDRDKEGAILIDSYGNPIQKLFEKARDSGQYLFVNAEEARKMVDKETLLIIVDTHRPGLLDCPDLLEATDKLVLIDHHRKSEDSIENATLTYMEAYASSTSELVTELLQYIGDGKKNIDKFEAEALLAGITVDTKNFSIKTGVRTFEAAAWLRRNGADTANVRQFFQTDMDFFKLKASIIAEADILPGGLAFSVCYTPYSDIQTLASQAADELLNIQDVRASFVVGISEQDVTVVSARSLGEVNVQTVMEKMGGGGHLATAGAQLDKPMEETIEDLKDLLREID